MLFVGQDEVEPFHFECESDPDFMSKFVESLEQIAKKVYQAKQRNKYFNGEAPYSKEYADDSWICEETLENTIKNPTFLDHCQFTGQFLGWAHNSCNINTKFKVPQIHPAICSQPFELKFSQRNSCSSRKQHVQYNFNHTQYR